MNGPKLQIPFEGKKLMDQSNRHAAFADGARYALVRSVANVAGAKESRQAGFKEKWAAIFAPRGRSRNAAARTDESIVVSLKVSR